ncbi:sigma-54 interaction domain-containing protein [Natronincola ferrireducens]|uniref:Transcriptional regulator containing PAS, AAA-type ATPase, and DNA-binding Fis domains n=1 Tax=Natronincola ferrireducens TaxID=393762 RepID=A0A1G8ZDL6_9FIRM|nr:sigma 54-interacting transcriptional regulator [Natronincola ferrireducens]SDK12734.1 Transcriptional regulator containing PAS, AAA-type ATPase, and DNA-binding Fis domains [Natronincola ferrireducens]
MFKCDDYKFFLENILGLMIINTDGKVTYMNQQCAEYIKVDLKKSLNKSVNEVFPPSKMMELLQGDKVFNTDFYFHEGRMSVSTQVQLNRDGKIVGVLEYDMIQDFSSLEEFIGKYTSLLDEELKYYREEFRKLWRTKYSIDNIIGSSEKTKELRRQIKYASNTSSTVLINGETGTGKELVAHSIHNLSGRSFQDFIKVNTASFPESLAESELFGYEEGAFTGAKKGGKKGKFELANGGTIFLDEISEMPLTLQPKILRVLQEKELDRVGGEKSIPINVRIIAATNKDLQELIKNRGFREDLFYRLNVFTINVPPLRERLEDLPELVTAKLEQLNLELGKNVTEVDKKVYEYLCQYNWPGNVRELHNVIEKAINYVEGNKLKIEHFGSNLKSDFFKFSMLTKYENPIEAIKREAETKLLKEVLEMFHGNKTKAAKYLKISRPLLYQKMNRLGLK